MRKGEIYRRNIKILVFAHEHPEYSFEEIGKEFGLTKQSISLIFKQMKEAVK